MYRKYYQSVMEDGMYVYRLCLSRKRMRRLCAGQVSGLDLITYGIYYKKYINT